MTTERLLNTYHNASTAPSSDVPVGPRELHAGRRPGPRPSAGAHPGTRPGASGSGRAADRRGGSGPQVLLALGEIRAVGGLPSTGQGIRHPRVRSRGQSADPVDRRGAPGPPRVAELRRPDRQPPSDCEAGSPSLIGTRRRNYGFIQASDRLEGDFTEQDEANLVRLAALASTALDALAQLHLPDYRRKVAGRASRSTSNESTGCGRRR